MHYHAKARKNMVQCQLTVNGVRDGRILQAFMGIERESFLPQQFQHMAYTDAVIDLGGCQPFLSPVIQGKMAQEAAIQSKDSVLVMGCPVGYMGAVLSGLARLVVYVSDTEDGKRKAAEKFYALQCDNVVSESRQNLKISLADELFEVILLYGCLPKTPENLLEKLTPNGSLFYIEHSKCPKVVKITNSDGCYTKQFLFDVFLPSINHFREKQFIF